MLTDDPAAPFILVVEDDDSHAELIRRSFESSSGEYHLRVAGLLDDARQVMAMHTPNLVLTDYRLPDGNGCDLVKMVNGACPVIMMTSQGNEQLAVDAMKAGVLDYVVKSGDAFSGMPRIAHRSLREWALLQERQRVEKELHRREQEFRALAENAPDPIFHYDLDCRRVYVNPAVERMIGKPEGCLLGKTPLEDRQLSPSDNDQWIRCLRQVMEIGLPLDSEVKYEAPNGHPLHFHSRFGPVRGADGEVVGVIAILRDITEIRMMQDELIKNQKLESLSVLAGGIAHDFNNILTGILGNISFARALLDESHRAAKILREAEKASERAADLARQLLTFAKGGRPIKKTVSVQLIIAASASFALRGANVSSVIEVPDNLHAIEADEGQISQVFGNIIINAVQAMPDGGSITITAENTVLDVANTASMPPGEYVKISFADTGCGMPDDIRKRIFEPYFTTKSGGNGLGLASANSIVDKHGGHISVRSAPGRGATFDILLPAADGKAPEPDADMPAVTVGEESGASLLVMDDDEIIRNMTTEMLGALGYHVRTCANGEEAVSLYEAAKDAGTPFAAVIMDLIIPGGMGGKEAARHILDIDKAACLIVSSGYSNDPIMAEYSNFGFRATIVKPYGVSAMAHVLKGLSL
jgi:PAS domain S-box-containing protein